MPQLGRLLIVVGVVTVLIGVVLLFSDKLPFLGKLPGDFSFTKGNFHVYFPLATMLIISVILTILLNLFGRWR
ncbi:MAG TPA: DUF2905 domain-containing protein [candidate division Zixibacteria bacterium]|nr:DUF2905 domain-containing protein [candidate division Zixibacteria bacterium]